ncbi:response regulator [Actinacidiphila rubida]|uniref:response regulator n=1 Tax=Actinacidiphila rubida TaxID=310780 RepID=UPI0009A04182|nr:response regulator transcription factor [Actinacidiphila rubida]
MPDFEPGVAGEQDPVPYGGPLGPTPAEPIRVLVVDDHALFRRGLEIVLAQEEDIQVIGEAGDGAEAVEKAADLLPDIVLMDVRMPRRGGIEAARRITGRPGPAPRIIMLTTFDLDEHVYDALAAGASGFLLKDMAAERLFEAVRVVASGEALLAPTVTRRLIGEFVRMRPQAAAAGAALSALTPRETDTLRLVAEGLSNAEIAERLVVSAETVKTHVSRVLTKLGARDRAQVIVLAYEHGLVIPGRRPDAV